MLDCKKGALYSRVCEQTFLVIWQTDTMDLKWMNQDTIAIKQNFSLMLFVVSSCHGLGRGGRLDFQWFSYR